MELLLPVPQRSQLGRRRVPKGTQPGSTQGEVLLAQAQRREHFARDLEQFPSFRLLLPPSGKATHPRNDQPFPGPRCSRAVTKLSRWIEGEELEGTCDREAGNKQQGSVSPARLKIVPRWSASPRDTGRVAAGEAGPCGPRRDTRGGSRGSRR